MNNDKSLIDIDQDESSFKSMTVAELKQKFIKDKAIPANIETLRFLFAGKQLENEKTLDSYKIQNRSVIMSIFRLPGGYFI